MQIPNLCELVSYKMLTKFLEGRCVQTEVKLVDFISSSEDQIYLRLRGELFNPTPLLNKTLKVTLEVCGVYFLI